MQTINLLLTARTPISHHDPATTKESNTLTFNRQKQIIDSETYEVQKYNMDELCKFFVVPNDIHNLFSGCTPGLFVATCMTKIFIDMYGAGEGNGLFSGPGRYQMLEARLEAAGTAALSTITLWNTLTSLLCVDLHPQKYDAAITEFFSLPKYVQSQVCKEASANARIVTTFARVWHNEDKRIREERGDTEDINDTHSPISVMSYSKNDPTTVIDIPAVSSNSIRHQLLRRPGWLGFVNQLGLEIGSLPMGVESIFENGGNIKAGARQPARARQYAQTIRQIYPLLDLLGGVTDSFDLGESKVKLSSVLVCKENASAIPFDIDNKTVSVFDMLDTVTATRQKTTVHGEGQMIYNFEVLVPGTQILVSLTLHPVMRDLTLGVLMDCLVSEQLYIGGQGARGYGLVEIDPITQLDYSLGGLYRDYIKSNRDTIVDGLVTGRLGCDEVVVS